MKAIFTRAMSFRGPGNLKILVQPSTIPQNVPEWIQETKEFELGLSDETIIDTMRPKPKAVEESIANTVQLPPITQDHLDFLRKSGVKGKAVQSIAAATDYLKNLGEEEQLDFFTAYEENEKEQAAKAAAKVAPPVKPAETK